MWPVLRLAARAALWRSTRELELVGLPSLLGWTVALAVVRIALQYAAAGTSPNFNPYGLNAVVAWLAFELAIAALFVRPIGRTTALSAMFALSILADVVVAAIKLGVVLLAPAASTSVLRTGAYIGEAIFAAETVWWLGAMVCVLRSLEVQSRLWLIGRVALLWAALFVANALVPHAPVFLASDFDIRNANWWEFLRSRYLADADGDVRLKELQAKLLQAEIAKLAPQRRGSTNLYVIGLAGWDQDVFAKELDGAVAALARVLPIKDRVVRLINRRDSAANVPLGTPGNFTAAVQGVGNVMDKDEDVLILVMTSHGDQTGFGLRLPGNMTTELTPRQVASTLDGEGIKNRVVIVSSCYAGIFLPPLRNDNTIVMAAADDKSTSFGCAAENDWTYFGDALFRQSLQPGADFQSAFDHARVLIQGWEVMDRAHPSNPQAHFGPAVVGKLAPLFASARTAAE